MGAPEKHFNEEEILQELPNSAAHPGAHSLGEERCAHEMHAVLQDNASQLQLGRLTRLQCSKCLWRHEYIHCTRAVCSARLA